MEEDECWQQRLRVRGWHSDSILISKTINLKIQNQNFEQVREISQSLYRTFAARRALLSHRGSHQAFLPSRQSSCRSPWTTHHLGDMHFSNLSQIVSVEYCGLISKSPFIPVPGSVQFLLIFDQTKSEVISSRKKECSGLKMSRCSLDKPARK